MNPTTRVRDHLLVLLVAVAVLVGYVTAPERADAATTHVTLTGASSAYTDTSTKLTGTWKVGSAGHRGTVTLQRRSGSRWVKVAAHTTSTKGVATFTVKPSTTTSYRLRASSGKTSATKKLTVRAAYTLTGSAGPTIMAGTSTKLTATYAHHGKAVAATSLYLERRSGSSWVRVSTVKIVHGKGTATVSPAATTTYRFRKAGVVASASHTVTVRPPSSFRIAGSGSGHGVGMSQYGAYELALEGRTAAQILATYYPGTAPGRTTNPARRISVQVYGPGSDTATSTTVSVAPLTAGTAPAWAVVDAGSATTLAQGTGAVTMTVGVTGGKPTATVNGQSYTAATLDVRWSGTSVDGAPTGPAAVASVGGAQGTYRNGQLVVTAIPGKPQPNVVNDVLLNTEYLYGLDEMPSSWGLAGGGKGLQALEAQVVAARGYAVGPALAPLKPACGCHVYDDTRSQNYTGWKKQGGASGSVWVQAVDATNHLGSTGDVESDALTSGGPTSYAQTVYFAATGAASGSGTGPNQDVFGTTAIGYLQGVPDPFTAKAPGLPASYRSWSRTLTQAAAKKLFALPDVKTVVVTARYPGGQIKTLTGTSAAGKKVPVTRTTEAWRTALGLPAAWVASVTPQK